MHCDPVTRTAPAPTTLVMAQSEASWTSNPEALTFWWWTTGPSFRLMRAWFVALWAVLAPMAASAAKPDGPTLSDDQRLSTLIAEALENRPEVSQAHALIAAESERVPQVGALPDPLLTFGIQNDSFTKIQIGQMETSWVTLMVTQTLPWYGKRGLRTEVASLAVLQAEADLERVRLSVRAEVERAYIDLLLVRDQLLLLGKLEALWLLSEGLARTRYEAGEGAQSDLLRAQLERTRLSQRRWTLGAEQQRRVAVLNRLRSRPPDESIATTRSLADIPDPSLQDATVEAGESETRSPELQKARLAFEQAGKRVDLAGKDFVPDPSFSAGVMPRGKLEPMWQVGVSFAIPVWAAFKQSRAVAENELRKRAAEDGTKVVSQLLRQRVRERSIVLEALVQTNQLYRSGLLVLSESTVTSTLAQYQVGRVTFASVLEVLAGYLSDVNGFLESVAATQRLATSQRELSLDPVSALSPGGMGTSVPGAGGMGAASSGSGGSATQRAEPGGTSAPGM